MKNENDNRLQKLQRHHPVTISLHWGIVLLIVISVIAGLLREVIEVKYWRLLLIDVHRQLGLLVMLGIFIRYAVRLRYQLVKHAGGMPLLMRVAAVCTQLSLCALLVALPIVGWASTNAHNLQVKFLGLISLPRLVAADSELADVLSDYHVMGSWILLGFVALHAGAALYHHYVRHDQVLLAMLPQKAGANLIRGKANWSYPMVDRRRHDRTTGHPA